MTLPSEIINKATLVLTAGGPASAPRAWCQGAGNVDGTRMRNVKDADARNVRFYRGGADKMVLNPDAVRYSAYAAIAKVLADRSYRPEQVKLMWDTLWTMALEDPSIKHLGGNGNHTHPLIAFNEYPGRTGAQVITFLKAVEARLKQLEGTAAVLAKGGAGLEEPDDIDLAWIPPKHGSAPAGPAAKPRAKRSKVVRASPPAKKGRKR